MISFLGTSSVSLASKYSRCLPPDVNQRQISLYTTLQNFGQKIYPVSLLKYIGLVASSSQRKQETSLLLILGIPDLPLLFNFVFCYVLTCSGSFFFFVPKIARKRQESHKFLLLCQNFINSLKDDTFYPNIVANFGLWGSRPVQLSFGHALWKSYLELFYVVQFCYYKNISFQKLQAL